MFHYRPAISSRQLRIVVAALVAIVAHIGLIGLNADRKPTLVPYISLPRSVNVFLGQNTTSRPTAFKAANELKTEKIETKQLTPDVQTEKYVNEKTVALKETESSVQPSLPLKETVKPIKEIVARKKQITLEDKNTAIQHNKSEVKVLKADTEEIAAFQKTEGKKEHPAALAEEGVQHPGVLQMAYPRYQLNSPPVYPGLARKRGQEGTVVLQVLVNRNGKVQELKIDVSSNFALLDRAALAAVKKWLFEPGIRDEERVGIWVKVPVTFKLKR